MERFYETIFILRPTLNDQEISEAIDNYRDLLVRRDLARVCLSTRLS